MIGLTAGDALKRLCIALALGLLASCGPKGGSATQGARDAQGAHDVQEMEAQVRAMKQHPSLVDAGKNAGPPIHVDPNPKSRGMHYDHHGAPAPSGH